MLNSDKPVAIKQRISTIEREMKKKMESSGQKKELYIFSAKKNETMPPISEQESKEDKKNQRFFELKLRELCAHVSLGPCK